MGSSGINAVHGESCSTQLLGKAKYHQTMSPVVTFTLLLSVIMVHVNASPVREDQSDGRWHVCVPHNSPQCANLNLAALRGKRSTDSDKGSDGIWHVCVPHNSPQCANLNLAALRGKRSSD